MASLGNDLATIREQQGKTLEEIHDATKIPVHILQAIEDGTIFTDFEENKTYIRSYIRSYGKALDITESAVIEALDHYELGTYDGQLLDFVDLDRERPTFTYDEDAAAEDVSAEKEEVSPARNEDDEDSSVKEFTPSLSRRKQAEARHRPGSDTREPSVSSVDWADLGRKFTPLENRSRIWIAVAVTLLVLAGVVGYWYYTNSDLMGQENGPSAPEQTQNITQPGIVPDSLQLGVSNSEDTSQVDVGPSQAEVPAQLSDTLYIDIYAAYNRLEPVRVYTDVMGEFNPYWIEQGDALRFEFIDFVRIMGDYDRMELLMNGHPVENFENRFLTTIDADSQYVELPRSLFTESDRWFQPPPDSTELNFPPPANISDRPRFPTIN
ncbi:MAG: helix-turn-helix domain-containing protein [Balneolaceae bacterium]|nr:helix-turn-helix domain-containing protein [Balneolaceae bacterium]